MIPPTSSSKAPYLDGSLAADIKDVSALRQSARQNSPEALKTAAKQFEALFMNMVMKSMREASPQDGMFDSEQSKMYTSMLDQQISQNMAKRGVGLADVLIRQLSNNGSVPAAGLKPSPAAAADAPAGVAGDPGKWHELPLSKLHRRMTVDSVAAAVGKSNASRSPHVLAFQERVGAHAEEASRTTGIPAKFMLAQAALESGWGKHEIVARDGTRSHNLFGIKASSGWTGKVVETATTEYVNGVPQTKIQKFRAYDTYADAFRDYAKMMRSNPRYEHVLANAQDVSGFAQGLQRAGYATDPNYAAKLTRIIKQTLTV